MVTICFGQMGCGKNHYGQQLAKRLNQPFVDGDDALPELWRHRTLFTQPDMLLFITTFLRQLIDEKLKDYPDFVLAQALYNEQYRLFLKKYYDCKFVYVKSSLVDNWINLGNREKKWQWRASWLICKPWFQEPQLEHDVIYNHRNTKYFRQRP